MLNNPINASDPTGHQCVGEPEECLDAKGQPVNGANKGWQNGGGDLSASSHPDSHDELNTDLLGEKELVLYNAYIKMWDAKDRWWWEKYGAGGFTIWEFMAVMWSYEQQGYPNTQKYAAAMGNHAPGWCDWKGCDPSSAAGSLTFTGRYNQVGVARAIGLSNGTFTLDDFGSPLSYWPGDSMKIVEAIQKDYFSGDPYAPYNLGNMSLRDRIFRKMAALGMIDTIRGLPGQDRMIILTYCQTLMMDYALNTDGVKSINMRTYRSFCP